MGRLGSLRPERERRIALATAAIATAVYKVVPEARRGEGSGYYALTVIAALALTPLIAILLQGLFGQAYLLSLSGGAEGLAQIGGEPVVSLAELGAVVHQSAVGARPEFCAATTDRRATDRRLRPNCCLSPETLDRPSCT